MAVCVPVKCHPVCAGFFCPETLTGERRRPPVDDHSYTNFLRNQAITIPPISSHRIQPKCFKWPVISEQKIERNILYKQNPWCLQGGCVALIRAKSDPTAESWLRWVKVVGDLQRWVWPSAPLRSWLFAISEQSHPAVAGHAADARGLEMRSMASAIRPCLHVSSSVCLERTSSPCSVFC